jgi:uncharacterized protein HemY
MSQDEVQRLFDLLKQTDLKVCELITSVKFIREDNEKRIKDLEDFKKNEEDRPNRILSKIGYTVLGTSITVILALVIKGVFNV